jgi:hypothetical protein
MIKRTRLYVTFTRTVPVLFYFIEKFRVMDPDMFRPRSYIEHSCTPSPAGSVYFMSSESVYVLR